MATWGYPYLFLTFNVNIWWHVFSACTLAADCFTLPGKWNCFEKNYKPRGLNFNMQLLILYYCDVRYSAWWKVYQSGLSGIFMWPVCVEGYRHGRAERGEKRLVDESQSRWELWEGSTHLSLHGIVPWLVAGGHSWKSQTRLRARLEVWSWAGDKQVSWTGGTADDSLLKGSVSMCMVRDQGEQACG